MFRLPAASVRSSISVRRSGNTLAVRQDNTAQDAAKATDWADAPEAPLRRPTASDKRNRTSDHCLRSLRGSAVRRKDAPPWTSGSGNPQFPPLHRGGLIKAVDNPPWSRGLQLHLHGAMTSSSTAMPTVSLITAEGSFRSAARRSNCAWMALPGLWMHSSSSR